MNSIQSDAVPMTRPQVQVLYEDNHLLVVSKPVGMATQGTKDETSVHQWAQSYIKRKYDKPGNVYVGIVSRLDKQVSGALVLARTSKAAARLTKAMQSKEVQKTYVAVCRGKWHQTSGTMVDHLKHFDQEHKVKTVGPNISGAKLAELNFETVASGKNESAFKIELLTGRKHQIRVQLASRGLSIIGDHKYGEAADQTAFPGIALHSWRLSFVHPVQKSQLTFFAELPGAWRNLASIDQIQTYMNKKTGN